MPDLRRILRECFWDHDVSEADLLAILEGDDVRRKRFLFEKILGNSTRLLDDMSLFGRDELKKMLEEYQVPAFNREHIALRKNMVEAWFFDQPLTAEELRWVL
ncbi:MAG: hypothetical protein H5U10_17260 [Desulfacinum sp.]|jgi:hypothetical protein|nr:hypothetical protein [Desulfacinum sp.]MBZ4660745.1 hypothetical protein [Desulfacinum sp.]